MVIYNSMILWVGAMALLYHGLTQSEMVYQGQGQRRKVPLVLAIFTFGYIIFWAAIRSGVADTATYISMFESYPSEWSEVTKFWVAENKAPGFLVFGYLIKILISDNYHVWLAIIALISGLAIMYITYKKSEDFFLSVFLFITTLNFFWMFNGIRQFMVAAMLFALSGLIEQRKTFQFIGAVLLLSTVHYTAIIMIPAYFIVTDKAFGKKLFVFIVILGLCLYFLDPFLELLEYSLADTGYGGFSEQFASDDGINPIRVIVMAVTPLLAFACRNIIRKDNNKYINICVNMSVISLGIYFFGIFTSGILIGRLPIYFELYNIILLPYLIKNCFTKESSKIMYGLCMIGFIGYYFLQMRNSYYISDITGLIGGF